MKNNFGPLTESDVVKYLHEAPLTGNEGASAEVKFVRQAATISINRYKQGERGVAIFLGFEGSLNKLTSKVKTAAKHLLVSCQDDICSSLWFSDYAFNRVLQCSEHNDVNDSNFMDKLESLNFVQHVTFVADLRGETPYAYIYLGGIQDGERRIVTKLTYDKPIEVSDLKETLDRFYHYIKTPQSASLGHQLKIWQDSEKGIPSKFPELQIQSRLLDSLRAKYVCHDVRAEGATDLGRYDIRISRKHKLSDVEKFVQIDWILELKALTDMTSTGGSKSESVIRDAIGSGVLQAKSYQDSEFSQNAALCCFVMTKDKREAHELFSHVAQEASDAKIHLWSWHLFRSSQEARTAANDKASGMDNLVV